MADIETSLKRAFAIKGAVAACLFDADTGMSLGSAASTDFDVEAAAAGNTDVLRAHQRTTESIGIHESVEDVLVSLETQFHLLRPLRSEWGRGLCLYLAVNREQGNLALARRELSIIEAELEL